MFSTFSVALAAILAMFSIVGAGLFFRRTGRLTHEVEQPLLRLTVEIKKVLIVQGAMGSAIFPMVLAKHYGGDPKTAFDTILSNAFLSILTVPIWIAFGMSLIGQ